MKTVVCNECGNRVSDRHVNKYGVCSPCISKTLAQMSIKPKIKICKKCDTEKPTSEFYKSEKAKDGLHQWCKACFKEYNKEKHLARTTPKKRCSGCGIDKPTSEFYKNRSTKDGLQFECKECKDSRTRKARLAKKMANAQPIKKPELGGKIKTTDYAPFSLAEEKQKPQNLKIHAAYLSVIAFLAVCILILLSL